MVFKSKKEIHVASVIYNMAGPEEDRVQYLQSVILSRQLMNSTADMAGVITGSFLRGPGMKLRSFFRWSRLHMTETPAPSSNYRFNSAVSSYQVEPHIPRQAGWGVEVQDVNVSTGDYGIWIEKYFIDNDIMLSETEWTADIAGNIITLNIPDQPIVLITVPDFDPKATYITAQYMEVLSEPEEETTPGPWVNWGPEFPSLDGYTLYSEEYFPYTASLDRVVTTRITYSDATPPTTNVVTTTDTESYTESLMQYRGPTSSTFVGNKLVQLREHRWDELKYAVTIETDVVTTTEEISPGVTRTTRVTTDQEVLTPRRRLREDTVRVVAKEWKPTSLYIYKVGSGNVALDSLFTSSSGSSEFYPIIPVRRDNQFYSGTYIPEVYEENKKAYRKAFSNSYDKLIEGLEDNEDLPDIDYAYIMFGVSLNTADKSARRYAYEFFRMLIENQVNGLGAYQAWLEEEEEYNAYYQEWLAWREDPRWGTDEFNLPEPVRPVRKTLQTNELNLVVEGTGTANFNQKVIWTYGRELVGAGLGRPNAKKGDLWIVKAGKDERLTNLYSFDDEEEVEGRVYNGLFSPRDMQVERIHLFWQDEEDTHRYIEMVGLIHQNIVYGGKYVEISAWQALDDADESGFILPLHDGVSRNMSLTHFTQMTTASTYMVFNCYQIVKKKWYQTGLFKVFITVAFAVVSVMFPGLGMTVPAILGTNAAVGSALGLSGLVGAIAGAVANAIAALIITSILTKVSIGVFGDFLGSLIGAALSFGMINHMSSMTLGNSSSIWGELMKMDNIMKMTDAIGQAYVAKVSASIADLNVQMEDMLTEAEKELKEIADKYAQDFGYGRAILTSDTLSNPVGFVDESASTFLRRTLMTGSDLVDLSHRMISEYVDLNLKLKGPFS